jgi:hypothetical protein
MASTVIAFISTPRSISVFDKEIPLISIVTIGFLGSLYLDGNSAINSDSCPTPCITGGSFIFLPGFLMQIVGCGA